MVILNRPWHIWVVSFIIMFMSASYFIPTAMLLAKTMMILGETDITFTQLLSPFSTVVLSAFSFLAGLTLFFMRKISLYLYLVAVLMNLGWLVVMQYFSAEAGSYSVQAYMRDLISATVIIIYIFSMIKRGYLR